MRPRRWCALRRAGGRGLAAIFAAGQCGLERHRGSRRTQVDDAIAEMLVYARDGPDALAIEPLHPAYAPTAPESIRQSRRSIFATVSDPQRSGALGVALDVYHIWWDPELLPQIERAGKDRLLAFHVCDWLVPTTAFSTTGA